MAYSNDPNVFYELSPERQKKLLDWIHTHLFPINTINYAHDSSVIRGLIDLGSGEYSYFSNGEFKGAMLVAGFKVSSLKTLNWYFNISENSDVAWPGKCNRQTPAVTPRIPRRR